MTEPHRETMLEVSGLTAFYGKAQILFDLSLTIRCGETVVLLGRNGAGKTTTFKSIIGLLPPADGEIRFKGRDITRLPPHKTCNLGIGYVPENRRIFTRLTVMENLEVGRQPPRRDLTPWTPERLFQLFPNLAERRNQNADTLSGGEQQMLTIARTLMGNPDLIILDEPSEGLAPVIVQQLATTIHRLKREGVSVFLAEQNLNFARFICDRAYIIHRGRVSHESAIDALSDEEYKRCCAI